MTGQRRVEFFRQSMGVLALCFLVGGFLFLIFPDQIIQATNWFARGGAKDAPVVSAIDMNAATRATTGAGAALPQFVGPPRLWPILSFTMMMMITVICALNWLDPRKYYTWVPLLLFSKACSSMTALLVFWISKYDYLADLLGLVVDFPIFLLILFIYLRARSELAEPHPVA